MLMAGANERFMKYAAEFVPEGPEVPQNTQTSARSSASWVPRQSLASRPSDILARVDSTIKAVRQFFLPVAHVRAGIVFSMHVTDGTTTPWPSKSKAVEYASDCDRRPS